MQRKAKKSAPLRIGDYTLKMCCYKHIFNAIEI